MKIPKKVFLSYRKPDLDEKIKTAQIKTSLFLKINLLWFKLTFLPTECQDQHQQTPSCPLTKK